MVLFVAVGFTLIYPPTLVDCSSHGCYRLDVVHARLRSACHVRYLRTLPDNTDVADVNVTVTIWWCYPTADLRLTATRDFG